MKKNAVRGKNYPLLDFEQFECAIRGFFSEYDNRQFINKDTLFSCALFSCALFPAAPQTSSCPDSVITYSASTRKWYIHTFSGEFKASVGDSLTEAMSVEVLKGLGIPFPSKETADRSPQAHTFEQFKFLVNWIMSAYLDYCEFIERDTLFSCAMSDTVYENTGLDRGVIVTYSASTHKWYIHTFFDGFSVFEGNSLEEVLDGD